MMRTRRMGMGAVALGVLTACSIFDDPTPETIAINISGSNGTQVLAIYAQQFLAGINQETNTTEVRVTTSDSVFHTLPIDTIIDIAESRQLFLQVETMPGDTVDVDVDIDINTRNVLNSSGLIFPGTPWRYVYQFNRPLPSVIEVIF